MAEENKNLDAGLFEEYFSDDLANIEAELAKLKELYDIIKVNIDKITNSETKGAYGYLIKHFENIIELQGKTQSMLKDKVSLKKIILDFAAKDKDRSSGNNMDEMMAMMDEFIKEQKAKGLEAAKKNPLPTVDFDLDSEIDKALSEEEE